MDGYYAYVWSAFGLTAAVLVANWWSARRRHAALVRTLLRRAEEVGS